MTSETDLHRAFGRMEGKIDALLLQGAKIDKTLEEHASRLQKLEADKLETQGALKVARFLWIAVSALIGAVASKLSAFISLGVHH